MFIGDDVFKPISALSGGERGRVQLAKIMLAGANFLILDEPTNHLDLFSKEILENALQNFTGTLLYISHDRYFINNTATRIMDLTPQGIKEYVGNYDYYLEKIQAAKLMEEDASVDVASITSATKIDYKRKKEQDAAERKKKSRLERLEKQIAETEDMIKEKDALLADDEIGRDIEKAQEIFAEKTKLEEELLILYDQWAEID